MAMKKYNHPAMPDWPTLWHDEAKGTAKVVGRVVSWRSHANGELAAMFLTGLVFLAGLGLLISIGQSDTELTFGSLAVFGGMAAVVTLFVVLGVVQPWLISTVFAKQVTIRFDSKAIRIGWKKYKRTHKGTPIGVGFQIDTDPEAARKADIGRRKLSDRQQNFLRRSLVVQLVMQPMGLAGGAGAMRTLGPGVVHDIVAVLDEQQAVKFSAVCITAAALTADEAIESSKPTNNTKGETEVLI